MIATIQLKQNARRLLILLAVCTIVVSCSKNDNPQPEPPPIETGNYNKLIRVLNFGEALPEDSEPLDDQAPIYYSLENNAPTPSEYIRTNRWDISFSKTYRSFIGGNNGADTRNIGANGPGKGGVLILEKDFDEVINIPDDALFRTGSALIGTDDAGAFGEGVGYYIYDFDGTIKGDGSYDKQHVAYVMQEKRTIVVRTAKGDYAKIKMLSIYKDLLDPASWKRDSPHPYFSFEYVLVKAGSKKFEIK